MEHTIVINKGATKRDIRQKVWDYIEAKHLANFPRPVHHRIPNFKTATQACNRLLILLEFQSSRVVKVNPDRPQEQARFNTLNGAHGACSKILSLEFFSKSNDVKVDPDKPLEGARLAALQACKTLLVPTPRLRTGLFNKIVPPKNATREDLRVCSTSQGVKEFSIPVGLDSKLQVDLMVVGSVAVSEKGYRIGKGEGFADMEYAMMVSMGAVKDSTVVVTVVHDCQVVDVPESLTESHDLTVDYILTPTRIIKTDCKHPKPQGIIWSKIDAEMLKKIPILKKLRAMEQKASKDVRLGASPSESENVMRESIPEAKSSHDSIHSLIPNPKRDSKLQATGLVFEQGKNPEEDVKFDHSPDAISTVYLGDIPAGMRVSELKGFLRERNSMPVKLTWQGAQHRAFLEYIDGHAADQALASLQGLTINGHTLQAERAKSQKAGHRPTANKAQRRTKP